MGSSLIFQSILLCCCLFSGLSSCKFIYPNFTASHLQFVDVSGAFLFSHNETFKAAIFNPGAQPANFYLCVIHVGSNTITWSANRDAPISNSGKLTLTFNGLTITDQYGSFKWETPPFKSLVHALMLTDSGNLVLLDHLNNSLWESFHYPTDTLVTGQQLPAGAFLSSSVSSFYLSTGDYRLLLTDEDVLMQWRGITYWELTMDTKVYANSNYPVEYMAVNRTGLYLYGHNGTVVVIELKLSPSDFRVAKIDDSGQFIIKSFSGSDWKQEFVGPVDECQTPFICGRLGLCTDSTTSTTPVCSCPSEFQADPQNASACVPSDVSFTLPLTCNSNHSSSQWGSSTFSYFGLGYGMDYFAIDFVKPVRYGVNLSICQDLCSGNCQCLGIFHENSSGSCYVLENEIGSIMSSSRSDNDRLGYIKVRSLSTNSNLDNSYSNDGRGFPLIALVFLPFTGFFLVFALGFLWWRGYRLSKAGQIKMASTNSPSLREIDAFSIQGLPLRFEFEELEVATDKFKTQIGSGGFGSVYKGILPDKTAVAVKKIFNVGVQGQNEFLTEIAIIGNIHHVNLVKLRGFCSHGSQRLLVYEYMNRGSLDRSLFGYGPVLEWQERYDIAIGTARGLAYLHSGCEHKIIHCDIKPENILLHDNFQAKISDFGLSKLLSQEQSSHFTTMRGTRGYLAPEWLTSSAISDKTDVYSFGMLLLEIVSGRKNCLLQTQSPAVIGVNSSAGAESLSSESEFVYFPLYALEMHEQGRYMELADARLEGRVKREEVENLVHIALCCAHEEPTLRPTMASVVGMLEGEIPLCQPRVDSLNFLRFYGQHNSVMHAQERASLRSQTGGSHAYFSYISSQQVSGPR